MRKKVVIVTCACLGILIVLYKLNNYIAPAKELKNYMVAYPSDDTLRIGIIGDSYADIHKQYDECLKKILYKNKGRGIPIAVKSSGKGGAKTRLIYTNMFEDKDVEPNSQKGIRTSKPIIAWHPRYCVIFGGVNDAICKMGIDYYTSNMALIIQHLLRNGIIPIIIEIPNVNLDLAYERNTRNKPLRYVTMWLTGSPFYCIDEYRKGLRQMIQAKQWNDSVLIIQTDEMSKKREFLSPDGVHPAKEGYMALDTAIADVIKQQEEARQ